MYIYKVTCIVNNKGYVGQTTKTVQERWDDHCTTHNSSCVFNKAIRKYGKESFLIEQVDTARTQEELDKKEIYWIKTLKTHVSQNGYNLEWGGNGRGKVSEETKQKISKAHKGRTLTEDWKKKISKSRQGQKVTEVTKKKISDTLLGHKVKLETREKISKANTGKNHPMFGKKHKEESKKKISYALSGENHPLYGKSPSKETRSKMSLANKGRKRSEEAKLKTSESLKATWARKKGNIYA